LKAILGIVSLLVVLAIVGSLAKRQLAAVGVATASGTTTPDARDLAVPQQARGIEEQARADTTRALQEGAKRLEEADR